MRKILLCLSLYLMSCMYHVSASAANDEVAVKNGMAAKDDVAVYVNNLYQSIDFGKGAKVSPEVFGKAMQGYLNLKEAGKLGDKQMLSIADFTLSSNQQRLWIIDLNTKKVVYHDYVAHGQGSGDEFANAFSNTNNSHQSSIGFYVTGETYLGEHGTSLRLNGMDKGYNCAALERGIVVHGADYVSKNFIAGNQRLGRSWGCPAVASAHAQRVIDLIKGGTCLFIYYPQKSYLAKSFWLNRKLQHIPAGDRFQLQAPERMIAAAALPAAQPEEAMAAPALQPIVARDTVINFATLKK